MDHLDRESFTIPSFSELYGFNRHHQSPTMATWLKQELQLIIAEKEIVEDQHRNLQALWSDRSIPTVERLKAANNHFEAIVDLLEEAHAEAFCNSHLVYKPKTFTELRIAFCDEFRGGDWDDENCWGLINIATYGAGTAEDKAKEEIKAREDNWYVPDWKLPRIEREIKPRYQFSPRTCKSGIINAFSLLEEEIHQIYNRVYSLACEAKRLLKYGH